MTFSCQICTHGSAYIKLNCCQFRICKYCFYKDLFETKFFQSRQQYFNPHHANPEGNTCQSFSYCHNMQLEQLSLVVKNITKRLQYQESQIKHYIKKLIKEHPDNYFSKINKFFTIVSSEQFQRICYQKEFFISKSIILQNQNVKIIQIMEQQIKQQVITNQIISDHYLLVMSQIYPKEFQKYINAHFNELQNKQVIKKIQFFWNFKNHSLTLFGLQTLYCLYLQKYESEQPLLERKIRISWNIQDFTFKMADTKFKINRKLKLKGQKQQQKTQQKTQYKQKQKQNNYQKSEFYQTQQKQFEKTQQKQKTNIQQKSNYQTQQKQFEKTQQKQSCYGIRKKSKMKQTLLVVPQSKLKQAEERIKHKKHHQNIYLLGLQSLNNRNMYSNQYWNQLNVNFNKSLVAVNNCLMQTQTYIFLLRIKSYLSQKRNNPSDIKTYTTKFVKQYLNPQILELVIKIFTYWFANNITLFKQSMQTLDSSLKCVISYLCYEQTNEDIQNYLKENIYEYLYLFPSFNKLLQSQDTDNVILFLYKMKYFQRNQDYRSIAFADIKKRKISLQQNKQMLINLIIQLGKINFELGRYKSQINKLSFMNNQQMKSQFIENLIFKTNDNRQMICQYFQNYQATINDRFIYMYVSYNFKTNRENQLIWKNFNHKSFQVSTLTIYFVLMKIFDQQIELFSPKCYLLTKLLVVLMKDKENQWVTEFIKSFYSEEFQQRRKIDYLQETTMKFLKNKNDIVVQFQILFLVDDFKETIDEMNKALNQKNYRYFFDEQFIIKEVIQVQQIDSRSKPLLVYLKLQNKQTQLALIKKIILKKTKSFFTQFKSSEFYSEFTPVYKVINLSKHKQTSMIAIQYIDGLTPLSLWSLQQIKRDLYGQKFIKQGMNCEKWFKFFKNYVQSQATWTILSFITLLGDRHLQKIMLNTTTYQITHINFKLNFAEGRNNLKSQNIDICYNSYLEKTTGTIQFFSQLIIKKATEISRNIRKSIGYLNSFERQMVIFNLTKIQENPLKVLEQNKKN